MYGRSRLRSRSQCLCSSMVVVRDCSEGSIQVAEKLGFTVGGANSPYYNGQALADEHDVVVVTFKFVPPNILPPFRHIDQLQLPPQHLRVFRCPRTSTKCSAARSALGR